jgi:polyhydroxybutyrate depolymerase
MEMMRCLLFCWPIMLIMATGAGAESIQIPVQGQTRTFLLSRPNVVGPRPTIIILHRGNGTADEELQFSTIARPGPQQRFVAVFPQARGGYWNFYPPGRENVAYMRFFERHGGVPNDFVFLKSIVAHLVQNEIADPKRIYLAGRSLGGVMALSLVCAHAESFAAVVLLSSAMPNVTGSGCQPVKPVPIFIAAGTDDRVLPYKGEQRGDLLWSAERLVTFFRQLNGCTEPAHKTVHAPNIAIESFTKCPGGPVVLHSIVGGGHDLPGGRNIDRTLLDFLSDKTR